MKKRGFGFRDAFRGIVHAILSERNFRVHIVAMCTVIYFGAVFGITGTEWAVLGLVISAVMAAELVNTSVEAIVDKLSPEKCNLARVAKDSAAAAVLVLAVGAVIVAAFIFSEKEGWKRVLEYIKGNYVYLIIFAVIGTVFVFAKTKDKEQ